MVVRVIPVASTCLTSGNSYSRGKWIATTRPPSDFPTSCLREFHYFFFFFHFLRWELTFESFEIDKSLIKSVLVHWKFFLLASFIDENESIFFFLLFNWNLLLWTLLVREMSFFRMILMVRNISWIYHTVKKRIFYIFFYISLVYFVYWIKNSVNSFSSFKILFDYP